MKKYISAKTMTKLFHFMSIGMFFALFYYGLGVTGEEHEKRWVEYITLTQDSILHNICKLCIAVLLLVILGKLYDKFLRKVNPNILLAFACIFTFGFSVYWLNAAPSGPEADQEMICKYATAFNQGDFRGLQTGSYVTRYPQQMGMITILRILFYFFGNMNYRAYQYLAAMMVPLLVLSGAMILRKLTNKNKKVEMYYLFFVISCFPMYAYVHFVYGDLTSTALGFLATWILLSCIEKFSVPKAVALGAVAGIMVQFRMNSLILLIAFLIVIVVKLLEKFRWQLLVTALSMFVGVALFHGAVMGVYEGKWNKSIDEIPALLYVVMGFNDDHQRAGWHNNYEYIIHAEGGDDEEVSMERGKKDLISYINLFWNDKEYAVDFFSRKMNAQWNTPMYQSRVLNDNFTGKLDRLACTIFYDGRLGVLLQIFMKVYQLLMYGSILHLLVTFRKQKIAIEMYVLLIAAFGGFLFSFIWEAKTRYMLPYFLMLIPYYAIAVENLVARVELNLQKYMAEHKDRKKEKSKSEIKA